MEYKFNETDEKTIKYKPEQNKHQNEIRKLLWIFSHY